MFLEVPHQQQNFQTPSIHSCEFRNFIFSLAAKRDYQALSSLIPTSTTQDLSFYCGLFSTLLNNLLKELASIKEYNSKNQFLSMVQHSKTLVEQLEPHEDLIDCLNKLSHSLLNPSAVAILAATAESNGNQFVYNFNMMIAFQCLSISLTASDSKEAAALFSLARQISFPFTLFCMTGIVFYESLILKLLFDNPCIEQNLAFFSFLLLFIDEIRFRKGCNYELTFFIPGFSVFIEQLSILVYKKLSLKLNELIFFTSALINGEVNLSIKNFNSNIYIQFTALQVASLTLKAILKKIHLFIILNETVYEAVNRYKIVAPLTRLLRRLEYCFELQRKVLFGLIRRQSKKMNENEFAQEIVFFLVNKLQQLKERTAVRFVIFKEESLNEVVELIYSFRFILIDLKYIKASMVLINELKAIRQHHNRNVWMKVNYLLNKITDEQGSQIRFYIYKDIDDFEYFTVVAGGKKKENNPESSLWDTFKFKKNCVSSALFVGVAKKIVVSKGQISVTLPEKTVAVVLSGKPGCLLTIDDNLHDKQQEFVEKESILSEVLNKAAKKKEGDFENYSRKFYFHSAETEENLKELDELFCIN